MISKEIQENIKKRISDQEGQSTSLGNQVIAKVVVLKDSSRIEAFEKAYPHFICYRKTKDVCFRRYIDSRTEETWQVITATENAKGYRLYKAIIDSTIDYEVFCSRISPLMSLYCCNVEFFD